jgi:hypothetical protein
MGMMSGQKEVNHKKKIYYKLAFSEVYTSVHIMLEVTISFKDDMAKLKKGDHFVWRHNTNGVNYFSYVVITNIREDGKQEFDGNCSANIRDIVLKTYPEAVVGIISPKAYTHAQLAGWPNNQDWVEKLIAFFNGTSKIPPIKKWWEFWK